MSIATGKSLTLPWQTEAAAILERRFPISSFIATSPATALAELEPRPLPKGIFL
jgi:hypothetical protein